MALAEQAHQLLERQKRDWDLLRDNYLNLINAQLRSFQFDGFEIKLQFNPGRIASSSAQVDEESIRSRPCFLCRENRPSMQAEFPLHDDLILLCNPYPIFPEHFTFATISHTPQLIIENLHLMLALARDLSPAYTVFYNGPKCGASAPDHLHFQAGTRGFMPIDKEYATLAKRVLADRPNLRAFTADSYLRHFIALESRDRDVLMRAIEIVIRALLRLAPKCDEPMLNLHVSFESAVWRTVIFPRARHRPSFYLAEGDARILLSPAAVDLGGVCITPIQRDFQRITRQQIIQMFKEVTLPADTFARVSAEIRSDLTHLA